MITTEEQIKVLAKEQSRVFMALEFLTSKQGFHLNSIFSGSSTLVRN